MSFGFREETSARVLILQLLIFFVYYFCITLSFLNIYASNLNPSVVCVRVFYDYYLYFLAE